jgi:uncharacterized protein YgiM (DUF1202 family)
MKSLLIVLTLACVSCSVTIANAAPVASANTSPTLTPASPPAPLIVVPTPNHVTTLGKLNIRELPDTSRQIIGWYESGVVVTVIALVDGIGCPRWYLVTHQGERGYICAEWTSK